MNPLMEAAQSIGLELIPEKTETVITADGVLDFDPENPPAPRKENSFEGFMGSFGSPSRWAGAN